MSKDTNVELILDVIRCARTARTEVDLEEATLLAIALGDVSGKTGEMVRDIRTRIINEAAPNDGPFRAYLIGDLRVVEEVAPAPIAVEETDIDSAWTAHAAKTVEDFIEPEQLEPVVVIEMPHIDLPERSDAKKPPVGSPQSVAARTAAGRENALTKRYGELVDATETKRRLAELLNSGLTWGQIARGIGKAEASIRYIKARVTLTLANLVEQFYNANQTGRVDVPSDRPVQKLVPVATEPKPIKKYDPRQDGKTYLLQQIRAGEPINMVELAEITGFTRSDRMALVAEVQEIVASEKRAAARSAGKNGVAA